MWEVEERTQLASVTEGVVSLQPGNSPGWGEARLRHLESRVFEIPVTLISRTGTRESKTIYGSAQGVPGSSCHRG